MQEPNQLLRELPSVDRLLSAPHAEVLLSRFNRSYVTTHCRAVLDELRSALRQGKKVKIENDSIFNQLEQRIARDSQSKLHRVINATGTILHTNLGRAALAQSAIDALILAATQSINLEYDVERGGRGRRETIIEE